MRWILCYESCPWCRIDRLSPAQYSLNSAELWRKILLISDVICLLCLLPTALAEMLQTTLDAYDRVSFTPLSTKAVCGDYVYAVQEINYVLSTSDGSKEDQCGEWVLLLYCEHYTVSIWMVCMWIGPHVNKLVFAPKWQPCDCICVCLCMCVLWTTVYKLIVSNSKAHSTC